MIGIIVHTLGEQFPFITSDFEHVIYGLILMLVVIFMPRGLFPTVADWIKKYNYQRESKETQGVKPSKRKCFRKWRDDIVTSRVDYKKIWWSCCQ